MSNHHLWTYRARPDPHSDHEAGVVDGDTYDLVIDGGFRHLYRARIRSAAVNTREIYGYSKESEEYQRGQEHARAARDWVQDVVDSVGTEWPLIVQTQRDTGKYGRWVAEIYRPEGNDPDSIPQASVGESLGEFLLSEFDDVERV